MNFESWFITATDGLAEPEKARLRVELEAHVEDELRRFQSLGVEPGLAEQLALEHLGDPLEMNQTYRSTYLTQAEYARWRRLLESKPDHWNVALMGLLALITPFAGLAPLAVFVGCLFAEALFRARLGSSTSALRVYFFANPVLLTVASFAMARWAQGMFPFVFLTVWCLALWWWWHTLGPVYRKWHGRSA